MKPDGGDTHRRCSRRRKEEAGKTRWTDEESRESNLSQFSTEMVGHRLAGMQGRTYRSRHLHHMHDLASSMT